MTGTATKLSIQLFSARKFQPWDKPLRMIAEAGYAHVETFGPFHDDPSAAAKLFASHGLTALSAHISYEIVVDETTRALDIANALGARFVIAPHLPPALRPTDADGWRRIGDRLARAAEIAARRGVVVAWHNHDFEFRPLPDGSAPIVHLLGDALAWEADLAWIARAGADASAWLARYAGRVPVIHAKDLAPPGEKPDEDGWADVGAGVMNWPDLAREARAAGAQLFVAEHDNPADFGRFARASMAALRGYARGEA